MGKANLDGGGHPDDSCEHMHLSSNGQRVANLTTCVHERSREMADASPGTTSLDLMLLPATAYHHPCNKMFDPFGVTEPAICGPHIAMPQHVAPEPSVKPQNYNCSSPSCCML